MLIYNFFNKQINRYSAKKLHYKNKKVECNMQIFYLYKTFIKKCTFSDSSEYLLILSILIHRNLPNYLYLVPVSVCKSYSLNFSK